MSGAQEFPPRKVRDVVVEVAKLLKERGETVSVAETVSSSLFHLDFYIYLFKLRVFSQEGFNPYCGRVLPCLVRSTTVGA
jgi:hypothetical protein